MKCDDAIGTDSHSIYFRAVWPWPFILWTKNQYETTVHPVRRVQQIQWRQRWIAFEFSRGKLYNPVADRRIRTPVRIRAWINTATVHYDKLVVHFHYYTACPLEKTEWQLNHVPPASSLACTVLIFTAQCHQRNDTLTEIAGAVNVASVRLLL